jgi:hypothetical protein
MKDDSPRALGGTCSLLAGVTTIVVAVDYLLLPSEQQDACGCPDRFLASLAHIPTRPMVDNAAVTLHSLLAVAMGLAILARVRPLHGGWVRWCAASHGGGV